MYVLILLCPQDLFASLLFFRVGNITEVPQQTSPAAFLAGSNRRSLLNQPLNKENEITICVSPLGGSPSSMWNCRLDKAGILLARENGRNGYRAGSQVSGNLELQFPYLTSRRNKT